LGLGQACWLSLWVQTKRLQTAYIGLTCQIPDYFKLLRAFAVVADFPYAAEKNKVTWKWKQLFQHLP
jgi:hypothetical protein